MTLRCYVVSLPGSERRTKIAAALAAQGLEFEFVDGVRGGDELLDGGTYDDRAFRRRYGRSSIPSEVGAVLAHDRAFGLIAAGTAPAAVMLEDDAVPLPEFAEVAAAAARALRQGDVALLFQNGMFDPMRLWNVPLPAGRELVYLHRREPQGAVATIVTRKAAARLSTFGRPVQSSPDDWYLFASRVVVRAVLPPVVAHDDETPSQIGAERFAETLGGPPVAERVRFRLRTSRAWGSRPARTARGLALRARAALLRAAP